MTDEFEVALRRAAGRIADSAVVPEEGLGRALNRGSRRRAMKAAATTGVGCLAIFGVGALLALSVFSRSQELDPQVASDLIGTRTAPTPADVEPPVEPDASAAPAAATEVDIPDDTNEDDGLPEASFAPAELTVETETLGEQGDDAVEPELTETQPAPATAESPVAEAPTSNSSATGGVASTTAPSTTTVVPADEAAQPTGPIVVGQDPLSNPPPPRPTSTDPTPAPAPTEASTAASPEQSDSDPEPNGNHASSAAVDTNPSPDEATDNPDFINPSPDPTPAPTDEPLAPTGTTSPPPPTAEPTPSPTQSSVPAPTPVATTLDPVAPVPPPPPTPAPELIAVPGAPTQCAANGSPLPTAVCVAPVTASLCDPAASDCQPSTGPECLLPATSARTLDCRYVAEYPCPQQSDVQPGYVPMRTADGWICKANSG